MMMERAKTASPPEPVAAASAKTDNLVVSTPSQNASAEERVQDLERRLGLLGEDAADAPPTVSAPPSSAFQAATAASSTAGSNATTAPAPAKAAPAKSNPLLARIMAAQERARLAEQKEKEAKANAEKSASELLQKQQQQKASEEAAKAKAAEEERIQSAKSALRSAAGHALEEKQDRILRELEGKPSAADATNQPAPPPFEAVNFPPSVGTIVTPPPLEDQISQQQQQQQAANAVEPPSFDFIEKQFMTPPAPPVPTAPSLAPTAPPAATSTDFDHLQGVLPMAPPQPQTQAGPPPPSFAEFEQQTQQQSSPDENVVLDDDGVFDFDLDGNPVSPEQRQAMMDEQRRLYEVIMKEKAANDAAIARASADAFDSRSSNAAARAMDSHNQAMDSVGRVGMEGPSEAADASTESSGTRGEEETGQRPRRMVKIGNGQTVALHGQERTKKAIKEGTAILVQCMNCQNWMQVTETATLMFCPVCQVVSPVVKQNEVMTKEEAIQLTMDRKLAERLQAEAYDHDEEAEDDGDGEGYFSRLFGGGSSKSTKPSSEAVGTTRQAVGSAEDSSTSQSSWWDKISSIVSYGVAEEPRERGDLGVTRPPGAADSSSYPGQRRGNLSPATSSPMASQRQEETQGLLRPVVEGNEANLPAARVAEQKPLFSCVYDSVSTAASAVFTGGVGEDDEGDVHGVDSSSLLAVTSAGREVGDGAGNYSRVPDNE